MSSCCKWPWEQTSAAPANCLNTPNNCGSLSGLCESLLLSFPGTKTCAEAIGELGKRVSQRLHAKVIVTDVSLGIYLFTIEKNRATSKLTVGVTANSCALPIRATLVTKCSNTSEAQLGTVEQFLVWVVENMK